jgi:hypothetical protein
MPEHERTSTDAGRGIRPRLVAVVAGVVRLLGTVAAVVLAAHVLLSIGGANPDNGITRFVARCARPLALGFRDLFMPSDAKLRVLVDYGIAAIAWLIVVSLVVRLIRRLG